MKMRMAKICHLEDNYIEKVETIIESLRDQFDDYFSMVNVNIRRFYEFLDDVGLEPAYTPRRLPYTIAHYRSQLMKRSLRNKRKHPLGNPMKLVCHSIRDPRDVSVLVAASPCDVALKMTTDLDGGTVITEYQCEGQVLTGVVPEDADYLDGTNGEPSELNQFLNIERMPIGSRSLVDVRGLVPAPPGDTLYGVPSNGKAFPVDDVPEHVNGFSDSVVEFCPGFGLSPVISDIGVSPSSQQET